MAALLSCDMNNTDKVVAYINECRDNEIEVLPPDINESLKLFSVNEVGEIRFGLSAIKGVGSAVVEALIKERKENGPFETLFDLTIRMPAQSINRKTMESLAYAGAFDCFGINRYQFFLNGSERDESTVLERALHYGRKVQAERNSNQVSLFGDLGGNGGGGLEEPTIPVGNMRDGKVARALPLLDKYLENDLVEALIAQDKLLEA